MCRKVQSECLPHIAYKEDTQNCRRVRERVREIDSVRAEGRRLPKSSKPRNCTALQDKLNFI